MALTITKYLDETCEEIDWDYGEHQTTIYRADGYETAYGLPEGYYRFYACVVNQWDNVMIAHSDVCKVQGDRMVIYLALDSETYKASDLLPDPWYIYGDDNINEWKEGTIIMKKATTTQTTEPTPTAPVIDIEPATAELTSDDGHDEGETNPTPSVTSEPTTPNAPQTKPMNTARRTLLLITLCIGLAGIVCLALYRRIKRNRQ